MPGALTSSYFSTGNLMYVSRDRHTTFLEVYPPGRERFNMKSGAEQMRAAARAGLPAGITVNVTGRDPLEEASTHGSSGGSSVLLEALIGGLGALVILLFVFGTLPAVLIPLVVAVAAILNTFTLVWALTYVTDVSIIVQFLIALVGLGVAIDYALLMIFRFRDELREGNDVESALVETMTHAGRSVIVSGSTVAVGLLSMVVLPLPLLRSMGIGGMLIPVVSVLAALTLLPAMLAVLGDADQQRAGDAAALRSTAAIPRTVRGAAGRASCSAARSRSPRSASSIVGVLAGLGTQLNPSEAQLKYFPGTGTAIAGRRSARRGRDQPRRDEAARRARRERRRRRSRSPRSCARCPASSARRRPPAGSRGPTRSSRRSRRSTAPRPGIQATIDRANASARGHGRDADRRRRGRPRLPARPVRQLPLRARVRPAPDADPAHAGVPLDRAGDQGGRPESRLARGRVRDRRLRLPAGPRLRRCGTSPRPSRSPPGSR